MPNHFQKMLEKLKKLEVWKVFYSFFTLSNSIYGVVTKNSTINLNYGIQIF